MFAIEE